jgi:hypothetical protein
MLASYYLGYNDYGSRKERNPEGGDKTFWGHPSISPYVQKAVELKGNRYVLDFANAAYYLGFGDAEEGKDSVAPELGEIETLMNMDETKSVRNEPYSIEEIINDIKNIVQEVTGRSNVKPYLLGAGQKKGGKITFEIIIPKTHLRESVSGDDIELAFVVKDMRARVSEDFKGRNLNVRVEKYE